MSSNRVAFYGVMWTAGTYAVTVVLRFVSSVILSRLLNPQLMGMVLVVHTVRQGLELSSDVGLAQNVVTNKYGARPPFFNTVWIMQMIRGVLLAAIIFALSGPLASLYGVPLSAFQLAGLTMAVSGLTSTSIFLLHRNIELAKLNVFDLVIDFVIIVLSIVAALISPTIEAMILAVLLGQGIRALASYFISDYKNNFMFSKAVAVQVLTFGRWIFLTSILAFLCASFDRLYLGQAVPLAVLGIYGLARALAELPTALAARISYSVLYPIVSSISRSEEREVRGRLAPMRLKILLALACAMAFGVCVADIAVEIIYDHRYHDAAWMLVLLLSGAWMSVLCFVNEYTLLGIGKPIYNLVGNGLKLAFYVAALPLALGTFDIVGVVLAVAFIDTCRYVVLSFGQKREHVSFLRQDVAVTALFVGLIATISALRYAMGFGTSFDTIPTEKLTAVLGGLL